MQIGCCCNVEDAPVAQAAGYDFIECKVTSLLPEEEGDAVDKVLAQHQASPVPISAFNVFVPKEIKIVGPTVDEARLWRYVENGLARVRAVGGELVVFGSGGARAIPENFPVQEAHRQTLHFLQGLAAVAEKNGILIVIEPLNRKETNTILSVPEAAELAREVNHPHIKALADFYHMDEEAEPLAHILHCKEWIRHIHVADTGRGAPGTGHYPYAEFAGYLRQSGYNGRVSIECRWRDFAAEAAPALQFLRQTLS